MRLHVDADPAAAAVRGAGILADAITRAVQRRGLARVAISGGSSPWDLFTELARLDLPWPRVRFVQVDERLVPLDDPARNLAGQRRTLAPALAAGAVLWSLAPDDPAVPAAVDLVAFAADRLRRAAGEPAVFDVVHLGLGDDGHTAGLPPDAAPTTSTEVVRVSAFRGHDRITCTTRVLDRARRRLFFVTGPAKRRALARLLAGDTGIVAARVNRRLTDVVADEAAAGA